MGRMRLADDLPIMWTSRHTRRMSEYPDEMRMSAYSHELRRARERIREWINRRHQEDLFLLYFMLLIAAGGWIAFVVRPDGQPAVVLSTVVAWLLLGLKVGAGHFRPGRLNPSINPEWEASYPAEAEAAEKVMAETEAEVRAGLRAVPLAQLYVLISLAGLAWYGVRGVIEAFDARTSLSPADAPAIVASVVGLPALLTAVVAVVPRVIRAWGAQKQTSGEGEAAVIRAKAELRRADAEYLRAEKGLAPLNSASDGPPALEPTPDPA